MFPSFSRILQIVILGLTYFHFLSPAHALTVDQVQGRRLEKIEVRGLTKTKEKVVRRELELKIGDVIDPEKVEESLVRLKNFQVFSRVDSHFERQNGKTIWVLDLEDRWTTIPFIGAQSGGGVTAIRAGVFDVNTFGTLIEVGFRYENLDGQSSGIVWFRDPRFLDKRILIGTDLWASIRNRDLYTRNRDLEGSFTHFRYRTHFFSGYEFHRHLVVGLGADLRWDDVSEDRISSRSKERNTLNGIQASSKSQSRLLELFADIGRINHDVYLLDGIRSRIKFFRTFEFLGSSKAYSQLSVSNHAFWKLDHNINIGAQFRFRHSTSSKLEHLFYAGGFSAVRGFEDSFLRDQNTAQANVELRIPSLQTPWVVLQHVAFTDAVRAAGTVSQLISSDEKIYVSAGTGIRLISPKIFSFNARIDVAYTFGPDPNFGLALGTQQFF